MPILDSYTDEIQPLNPAKTIQPIRNQDLKVTPKIEKWPKMRFGTIKADTPVSLPHIIHGVKKQEKVTSEWQEKAHTNKLSDPESTI